MAYRGNNYSFVIDSSFQPFSMQEMLVPFSAYKDAFEQAEATYTDLSDKSDRFKYLSETLPEGSKARALYEGYANDLQKQADDLAKHGLSMMNRSSLMNLKRRYQGEIGRLVTADAALQEEKKLRRTMNAKDGSMLYALDNLDIDQFLDGNTPNLYNISGNELYARGAQAGKSASSRVYSAGDEGSTLGGYYRKWVERNGYSKDSIDAFRANAGAIPELQQAADDILAERGVLENLSGNPQALQQARQSVLNGIIDGAVYQESVKPVRDEGVMSASAAAQYALQRDQMVKNAAQNGLTWNDDTKSWDYNMEMDPSYQRQRAIAEKKQELKQLNGGSGSSGRGKSTERAVLLNKGVRVKWNGDNPNDLNGDADDDISMEEIATDDVSRSGLPKTYDQLPTYAKNKVDAIIGDRGDVDHYLYYFKGFERGTFNDAEAQLEIIPRRIVVDDAHSNTDSTTDSGSSDFEDIFSDTDLE